MVGVVSAISYDSSLTLENKDSSWQPITGDGIQAILQYNSVGQEFEYSLSATGLASSTNYSLIYYADKPNRFENWGGNNPGALIATIITDESGNIDTPSSIDLGMDLPSPNDANIDEYNYCLSKEDGGTGDMYNHCHGAKIWLVPTGALPDPYPGDGIWQFWNAAGILFETDLITYVEDDEGPTIGNPTTIPEDPNCNYGTISNPILVQVEITDESGVDSARFNWQYGSIIYNYFMQPLGEYENIWQTLVTIPPEDIENGVLVEYKIFATDNVGNEKTKGYHELFTYDCSPPETILTIGDPKYEFEFEYNETLNMIGYFVTSNTEFTLNADDGSGSGVDVTYYAVCTGETEEEIRECMMDENNWQEYENPFTIIGDDGMRVIAYRSSDNAGNWEENEGNFVVVVLDNTPPDIYKEVVGPQIGVCPPVEEGDECYIQDETTEIIVETDDGEGVDLIECEWYYILDGEWTSSIYDYTKSIVFPEDTVHELHIICWDTLGNEVEDVETFYVDSTGPSTIKFYGEPIYPWDYMECVDWCIYDECGGEDYECIEECNLFYVPKWINSNTPITLESEDLPIGECAVGVDKIYWRNTLVDDVYCWNADACYFDAQGEGEFQEYIGPFTKDQESCHLIEYYSVDLLGNEEEIKKQCVFVENTPPIITKEVGEPKVEDEGFDYITTETPIYLYCEDQEPHPSGEKAIYYRWYLEEEPSEWVEVLSDETTFSITEESYHVLEYYCIDNLGHESDMHTQYYDVDDTPPEITIKNVYGSQIYASDFILNITEEDEKVGVNDDGCEYRVINNGTEIGPWTSRNCNDEITITVGDGMDCDVEGENVCQVEIKALDLLGNIAVKLSDAYTIDWTNAPQILSSGPSGTVVNSFTSLYVETNKPATCRYDTEYKSSYDAMSYEMEITGNLNHYQTLSGLTDTTYNYYVLCKDTANNAMAYPASISFEVDTRENFVVTIPEGKGEYLRLGWNQFFLPSFVLDDTTLTSPYTVETVLQSIEGSYDMLYHFDGSGWKTYDPTRVTDEGEPLNDLTEFDEFNGGGFPYFINMNVAGERIEIV